MLWSGSKVLVETRDLVVKYRYVLALDNVSVKIPEGKTLMVGSNGSGKTTLLKVVAGLIRPAKGYVRVLGHDPLREFSLVASKLLFVRDCDDIYHSIKVATLIRILSKIYGEDKTMRAVETLGLIKHMDKRVCELSKGLKRRVALLEALVADKKLILLDEPLSGLDYESREIIGDAIRNFMEDKAVIIASHLPVKLDFDYLVVLEAGRLVYSGEYSEDIVSRYFRFY